MNKATFIVLGAVVIITAVLVLAGKRAPAPESSRDPSDKISAVPADSLRYENSRYGISFTYLDAYALSEQDAPGSGERLHHVITLTRKEDLPLPENGEGPPAITIDIYQNDLDKLSTEQWIRNTSASNFKLGGGSLATTSISGMPALSYRWSGLYEGTTVVQARDVWVYAFTVTYLEMGADIIQDFVAIRDSVRITEE
ncbi:hypothetical protein FJY94_02095 [Candidatus Kaiserbacteria bacterium]|nr:hypothetical protein [Candidatus Kaiserbacteria bacterium]